MNEDRRRYEGKKGGKGEKQKKTDTLGQQQTHKHSLGRLYLLPHDGCRSASPAVPSTTTTTAAAIPAPSAATTPQRHDATQPRAHPQVCLNSLPTPRRLTIRHTSSQRVNPLLSSSLGYTAPPPHHRLFQHPQISAASSYTLTLISARMK
ncbi:unnamed protein product [Pleuronectes platessa]|uniref:Uncharacterized protein n=1 Tax=Pleuronectes platessa TaxID=8262 RepID=A0A9N7VWV9_PLEPL|nr:unnamed protein product [Pleuronectes platessa]